MAKVEKSIIINAPVEKVFSYMDDPMSNLEWLPGMIDVKHVVQTPNKVGTHFRWTYKMAGIRFKGETTTTEYVLNKRVVTQSKGGISSTWTFTYEPQEEGTKLTLSVDYSIPIPVLGKLAESLVLKQNEREANLAISNVKEKVEGVHQ
jgi:carbon monoxide dehydrogenase subunit G